MECVGHEILSTIIFYDSNLSKTLSALSDGDDVPCRHCKFLRCCDGEDYSHPVWLILKGRKGPLFRRRGKKGHCRRFYGFFLPRAGNNASVASKSVSKSVVKNAQNQLLTQIFCEAHLFNYGCYQRQRAIRIAKI